MKKRKLKLTWEDMKEMLEYGRKNGHDAFEENDEVAIAHWVGFSDAVQSIAFMLYPKQFNKWFFDVVLKEATDKE